MLHTLVIGHSGGGKTVFMHALACYLKQRGARVVACSVDAAPGMYPGCEVVGHGENVKAIHDKVAEIHKLYAERAVMRGSGIKRDFTGWDDRVYLFIDEYDTVATDNDATKEAIEDILRRGRKRGIHLFLGVQDKLVKTMGFEGKSDLRKQFTCVVDMSKDVRTQKHVMTLTDPRDGQTVTFDTPTMVDPEDLAEAAIKRRAADSTENQERKTPPVEQKTEAPQKTVFQASESDFLLFQPLPKEDVIALISYHFGRGVVPSKIPALLPRYRGEKYRDYKRVVDQVVERLKATDPATDPSPLPGSTGSIELEPESALV